MGHAGAADGLDQGFLDNAVFNVQAEFAAALLGGAPADAVGVAGNVFDFLSLVGKRRQLLDYLQRVDIERYRAIIKELGLRR